MGYGDEAETVNASTGRPANNALKLTSLASLGGLGSQLNAVFSAPREDRARELVGSTSPLPDQTHDRAGSSQRGARPRGLKASRHGDTVSDPACHGACSREPSAAPRLRSRPISERGPERDSPLNMRQGALGPSRDTATDSRRPSCSRRDVRQATATTWARMVAPCGCGA